MIRRLNGRWNGALDSVQQTTSQVSFATDWTTIGSFDDDFIVRYSKKL